MNSIRGKKKHCQFNPTNLNLFFVYNNFILKWKQIKFYRCYKVTTDLKLLTYHSSFSSNKLK